MARGPVQALELIDEHGTFDLINRRSQRERVGLAFGAEDKPWPGHWHGCIFDP